MQLFCFYRHPSAQIRCGMAGMEVLDLEYAEAIKDLRRAPLNWVKTNGIELSTMNLWCLGNSREAVQARVTNLRVTSVDGMVEHIMPIVNRGVFSVTGSEDFVGWVQVFKEPSKAKTLEDALQALLTARGAHAPRHV